MLKMYCNIVSYYQQMSKVIDVTSKIKEYFRSDECNKLIQNMVSTNSTEKYYASNEYKSIVKNIMLDFSRTSEFTKIVEKIYNDITSGTTFWEKMSKDILVSSTIKSQAEIVAENAVKSQIKRQLSNQISSNLTKQIPVITRDIILQIKKDT